MSEINFSKKQLAPLINKYGINTEKNTVFQEIVCIFKDSTDYQKWAIKLVFSSAASLNQIHEIKNWAEKNPSLIKSLSKQNIISYKNKHDIIVLFGEIAKLNSIMLVKHYISRFNGKQRTLLNDFLKPNEVNIENYDTQLNFPKWVKVFEKFNVMTENRRQNFFNKASAFATIDELLTAIEHCTKETYDWNKEEVIDFMKTNAPNCKIIFESEKVLLIELLNSDDCHIMCGNGHTGWCISDGGERGKEAWKSYVNKTPGRRQYALFNFAVPESDEIAHVGFTVHAKDGVVEGQSTHNHHMCGSDTVTSNGKEYNVHDCLSSLGISFDLLMKIEKNKYFEWSKHAFVEYIFMDNTNSVKIIYNKGSIIIVEILREKIAKEILSHSFTSFDLIDLEEPKKAFILLDFSKKFNDDNALIYINCNVDEYNIMGITGMYNLCGANITNKHYLNSINISTDDFLERKEIDPNILLHKYISEGDEEGALKLLANKDINVNYEFNNKLTAFSAISMTMVNVFRAIINHPSFDIKQMSGSIEPLFHALLYIYADNACNNQQAIKEMIDILLDSTIIDFNEIDINDDTPLMISCMYPSLLWVTKKLLQKKVNIDMVNDTGYTAFGNAYKRNNYEALKELADNCKNITISKEDAKLFGSLLTTTTVSPEIVTKLLNMNLVGTQSVSE
jgi:hypothetical protein